MTNTRPSWSVAFTSTQISLSVSKSLYPKGLRYSTETTGYGNWRTALRRLIRQISFPFCRISFETQNQSKPEFQSSSTSFAHPTFEKPSREPHTEKLCQISARIKNKYVAATNFSNESARSASLPPWPSGGGFLAAVMHHSTETFKANTRCCSTVEAVAPTKPHSKRREEPRSCNEDPRPAYSIRRFNKRFAGYNIYRFGWE